MTSEQIVLLILIVNVLVALAVFIWDMVRKKGNFAFVHLFVMLFCPLIGPMYFLGAHVFEMIFSKKGELAYEDIGFDTARHVKKIKGNFLEEIDIVPLEEAFEVSDKNNRRRALLNTLKKDYQRNIATVQQGLNNEDTETSHYVATIILATTTEYLNTLQKLRLEYEKNENQPQATREYLDGLSQYLQSGIMDAVDKHKYSSIFVDVMDWLYCNYPDSVVQSDFVYVLQLLIESENFNVAAVWSTRALEKYPNEDQIYHLLMKIYYTSGHYEKFKEILENVMKSDINISNETLQTIRFFLYKQQ